MKKSKGFTLIETLITVGIVSLIAITLYSYYSKKSYEALISRQINYLVSLDIGVQNFIRASANLNNVTPANLINSNVVPTELVQGATLRNAFGGNITFAVATSFAANDSLDMTVTNLPIEACMQTISSRVGETANRISVNGFVVKDVGDPYDSVMLANATLRCLNNTNTVVVRKVVERANLVAGPGGDLFLDNALRQRDPYYVPSLGNLVTSPAVVCQGGSAWNGAFCSCAAGSKWNGFQCVVYNDPTVPGTCPLGQGWDATQTCQPLPNGVSPGETYTAGRRVPNNYAALPLQRTVSENPAFCTAPGSFYDGRTCLVCINGATWNGFRCVTNN